MSDYEIFAGSQEKPGSELGGSTPFSGGQAQTGRALDEKPLEYIIATGLGSRGGPNKESNKFRTCPSSYHPQY